MQAGAIDDAAGDELHGLVAADAQQDAFGQDLARKNGGAQGQQAAGGFQVALQGEHQAMAVDDAGGGRFQCGHALQRRLARPCPGGVQPAQVVHAVGGRRRADAVQGADLFFPGGDDELAAARVGYAVGCAVVVQGLAALDAQPGLERAARVVETGVDDFAVARAGGGADGGFGFQRQGFQPGQGAGARHGQADDAGADDDAVDAIRHGVFLSNVWVAVYRRLPGDGGPYSQRSGNCSQRKSMKAVTRGLASRRELCSAQSSTGRSGTMPQILKPSVAGPGRVMDWGSSAAPVPARTASRTMSKDDRTMRGVGVTVRVVLPCRKVQVFCTAALASTTAGISGGLAVRRGSRRPAGAASSMRSRAKHRPTSSESAGGLTRMAMSKPSSTRSTRRSSARMSSVMPGYRRVNSAASGTSSVWENRTGALTRNVPRG